MNKTMQTLTRREFSSALFASLAFPSWVQANALTVSGVRLGLQTYSFHDFTKGGPEAVAAMAAALKRLSVDTIELFSEGIEPFPMPTWSWKSWQRTPQASAPVSEGERTKQRVDLRDWRIKTPDSYFTGVRSKFAANGIRIYCFNYSFAADMTDDEIDAGFRHARLLGAKYITSSSTLSVAKRLVPFAAKHKQTIGWHGHADIKDPEAISTPQTFARLMKMSPYYRINLDIGHFTAAGFDPVAFIEKEHANITNLHIKDRLKNGGDNKPLGEGDTNLTGVLHLLRDKHYDIPAFFEYEYVGSGSSEQEIEKSLQYAKRILQAK